MADTVQSFPAIGSEKLPEGDGLSVSQAEQVALQLRTKIRKDLLQKLDEDEQSDNATSFIDRWELENYFVELEKYGDRLSKKLADATRCEPSFEVIQRSDDSWLRAEADLFLTPESGHYVHGPVLVYHAVAVSQCLLAKDDDFIAIAELVMRKEISHKAIIDAWNPALRDGPEDKKGDFSGRLLTRHGHEIMFCGCNMDPLSNGSNSDIRRVADYFAVPANTIPAIKAEEIAENTYRVKVSEKADDALREVQNDIGQLTHSRAWIAYAVTDILSFSFSLIAGSSEASLKMLQTKSIPLPDDLPAWLDELQYIEIQISKKKRQGPDNISFTTGSFQFCPNQPKPSKAMIAEIPLNLFRCLNK